MPYTITELQAMRERLKRMTEFEQNPAKEFALSETPGFAGYEAPIPASNGVVMRAQSAAPDILAPDAAAAAPVLPAAGQPRKFGLSQAIAAGLQGAAAGIQANVGRATGPKDAQTGLFKGIVGVAGLRAEQGRADSAAAAARQGLSDKLAIALAKRETPADAAAKAEAIAKAEFPYKMQLQNASGEVRERVARIVREGSKGLTAAQAIELNNKVLDQVDNRFKTKFNFNPSEEEMQKMITDVKRQMTSGTDVMARAPGL